MAIRGTRTLDGDVEEPNLDEYGNPVDDPNAPIAPAPLDASETNPSPSAPKITTTPVADKGGDVPASGNTGVNPDAPYTPPAPPASTASNRNVEGGGNAAWGASSQGGAIAGWDGTKWTDPNQQALKYRFGREIANSGLPPTADNAQKIIQQAIANGVSIQPDPNDPSAFIWTNTDGQKESSRLVGGGAGNSQWMFGGYGSPSVTYPGQDTPAGGSGQPDPLAQVLAQQSQSAYAPTVTAPVTSSPTVTPTPSPVASSSALASSASAAPPAAPVVAAPAYTALDEASQAALLRALQGPSAQDIADNIENDPAVSANRRTTDRQYDSLRARAAEQAALDGTNSSGGFNGLVNSLDEDRAESEGRFAGDRVSSATSARVQELQNAISLANQSGQFDRAQQLQAQLANAQSSLTTRGQDLQEAQSLRSLGLAYDTLNVQQRNFASQLTQQDRQFGATLTQNQQQFVDSLGLNYAQLSASQRLALSQLAENARQANNSLGYNYDALTERANEFALTQALGGS